MIQELVELGKKIFVGKDEALAQEPFTLELVIDSNGRFETFVPVSGQTIESEVLTSKKGSARFLLDRCEEVLGITSKGETGDDKKFQLFQEKIEQYRDLPEMKPVFLFYEDKGGVGLSAAKLSFVEKNKNSFKFSKGEREGNITFKVRNVRLLNLPQVRNAIIQAFQEKERKEIKLNGDRKCAVCGRTDKPIVDEPHGLMKLFKEQKNAAALISYNENAFESYGLKGNLNSFVCRSCARNYMEGLRYLSFNKEHRFNISDDTAALFWLKNEELDSDTDAFSIMQGLNTPQTSDFVKELFNSVWGGEQEKKVTVDSNLFYCCTISVAAARFAVQDWTVLSLPQYKQNIADWFKDIEIQINGEPHYSSLYSLISATQSDQKERDRISNSKTSDLKERARLGSILFNAAIKGRGNPIPVRLLSAVLNRIQIGDNFSSHRAAIIKLIINRLTDIDMKPELDKSNRSIAYLCGRLFAVMESMQWKAMGNLNSGLKERFFAAAALRPANILGTLMTRNVPIYQKKINGYLAKEYAEIAYLISEQGSFPNRFTQIEQGEFALGYYFQKNNKLNSENNTIENKN